MSNHYDNFIDRHISFWELLEKNPIEIPMIQRDYAQGRKHEKKIRDQFINDLFKAIEDEQSASTPLSLDFVYGRIIDDENSELYRKQQKRLNDILQSIQAYVRLFDTKIVIDEIISQAPENHLETHCFIPLDGQQRLTTLFILHLMILSYRAQTTNSDEELNTLSHFSYKTRNSSREFLTLLTQNGYLSSLIQQNIKLNTIDQSQQGKEENKLKLSTQIKETPNFFTQWLFDPTVQGILVVIDAINERLYKFNNEPDKMPDKIEQLWKSLTKDKKVIFDYLDIDALKQTDRLYITMNARGKQLNQWENFKAWLIQQVSKSEHISSDLPKDWESRLDQEWYDLFWQYHSIQDGFTTDSIDASFLQLIMALYLPTHLSHQGSILSQPTNDDDSSRDNKEKKKILNHHNLYTLNNRDPIPLIDKRSFLNTFSSITIFLDHYCQIRNITHKKVEDIIRFYRYDNEEPSQLDKLILGEFSRFTLNLTEALWVVGVDLFIDQLRDGISKHKKTSELFSSWMRVIANYLYNRITDSPERYLSGYTTLKSLAEQLLSVTADDPRHHFYDQLSSLDPKKNDHLLPEIRKAKLIKRNPDKWEALLLSYELNNSFYGDLTPILDYIEHCKEVALAEIPLEHFERYASIIEQLLSGIILNNEQHPLTRALIIADREGKTYHSGSSNYSFHPTTIPRDFRGRREKWGKFWEMENWKSAFYQLIDYLDSHLSRAIEEINSDHIKDQLFSYIENIKCMMDDSFHALFVDHPQLITQCEKRDFRFNCHWLVLLSGVNISGSYKEGYSFALYLTLKEQLRINPTQPFILKSYHSTTKTSPDSPPGFWLCKNDEDNTSLFFIEPDWRESKLIVTNSDQYPDKNGASQKPIYKEWPLTKECAKKEIDEIAKQLLTCGDIHHFFGEPSLPL